MKKILYVGALLLSGCASDYVLSNTASSTIEKNGAPIGTMNFHFAHDSATGQTRVTATSSTGENYVGDIQRSKKDDYQAAHLNFSFDKSADLSNAFGFKTVPAHYQDASGPVWRGDLRGSKGDSFACEFHPNRANRNPVEGGQGRCSSADDRAMAVSIPDEAVKN